jgi:hypothetical protein
MWPTRDCRSGATCWTLPSANGRAAPLTAAREVGENVRGSVPWELSAGGFGIHWPEVDEDLSVEGLLRGAPAASRPASAS